MARSAAPIRTMPFEATVPHCMVIEGELPADLNGGFYRNGPSWRRPTRQRFPGLFSLDGMVQALVIQDGRVEFRNRWIRTPKYQAEELAGRALFEWTDGDFGDYRSFALGDVRRTEPTQGIPQGTSFVNVFPFAGQVLTSGEQGAPPIALDPFTLDTVGIVPWSSELSAGMHEPAFFGDGAFTAHPKWDSETGTLYGWTFRDVSPFVTLHWVSPDGTVRTRDLWDAPYPTLAHDMWLTERYMVLPFQPFFVDRARIERGLGVYGWDPDLPIILALIPRDDINGEIRWIETDLEPQWIMHTLSANHDGNTLILDGPIFDHPPFQFEDRNEPGTPMAPFWDLDVGVPGRWTVDLESGRVKSERLGDRATEFPKVDERHYGRPYEWGFYLAGQGRGMKMDSLVHVNVRSGTERIYQISRNDDHLALAEATFVPRTEEAPEGDGYVVVPVSDGARNTAQFLFFDTDDITQGPIARVHIPFGLGWTPHGHWMSFR